MSIVAKEDFTGEYSIAQTLTDHLDLFILKYEKQYLIKMLGATMYASFISDLSVSTPQAPITASNLLYFNSFAYDEDNIIITSEGIRSILVKFIYFEYIRETQLVNTSNGTSSNAIELGVNASYKNNILKAYNNAIEEVKAVQWYIYDNESVYPDFNGQTFNYIGIV